MSVENWFNKAKSFVYDSGESESEPEVKEPTPQPSPSFFPKRGPIEVNSLAESAPIPSIQPQPAPVEIDPKFFEFLEELMHGANLPGPDYYEFKEGMEALAPVGLNEQHLFKTAYVTLKSKYPNLQSPQHLIDTARHYIGLVQKEKNTFLEESGKSINTVIAGYENDIKSYETANQNAEQEIARLQQHIRDNTLGIATRKKDIEGQKQKLADTQRSFVTACDVFVKQVDQDIACIQSYVI